MIIITGLGRCGTTLMAKWFKEMGFEMGVRMNYHEEYRAGMELTLAYSISRDMYTDYICPYGEVRLDDPVEDAYWGVNSTIRKRIHGLYDTPETGKIEVFKDPRITWDPLIIRAWHEVIPKDIQLIICHRDFDQIRLSREVTSRQSDDNFLDPKGRKITEEFQIDFANFMTEVYRLKIPHHVFMFPDFLMDFEEMYTILHPWIGDKVIRRNAVQAFQKVMDWSLVHDYSALAAE